MRVGGVLYQGALSFPVDGIEVFFYLYGLLSNLIVMDQL